ncbi:MAG: hypothetical protein KDK41_02275 [Leptospiraceae bacterium]|nr:hypothetical protein [Leptospiraceae bacterium]
MVDKLEFIVKLELIKMTAENSENQEKIDKLKEALSKEVEKIVNAQKSESPVDKLLDDLEKKGVLVSGLSESDVRKVIQEIQSVHMRNVKHLEHIDKLLETIASRSSS